MIDQKIAEMMGVCWHEKAVQSYQEHNLAYSGQCMKCLKKEGWINPHYSTTWEGMRIVVEWMREQGFYFGMKTSDVVGTWSVYFEKYNNVGETVAYGGLLHDTAPMAVCLAALKAKGVEI